MRNDEMDNPLRNFKFSVHADGNTNGIGMMAVTGLVIGQTDKLKLVRGIPSSGYVLFQDWMLRPPTSLVIGVKTETHTPLQFLVEDILPVGVEFSDLDAGGNNLMVQQIRLSAEIALLR